VSFLRLPNSRLARTVSLLTFLKSARTYTLHISLQDPTVPIERNVVSQNKDYWHVGAGTAARENQIHYSISSLLLAGQREHPILVFSTGIQTKNQVVPGSPCRGQLRDHDTTADYAR
jgi:hypothetical protein